MPILVVVVLSVLLFGSWLALSVVLLGWVSVETFTLTLPNSTAEFGDSIGMLNGLFSSFAVLLALVAVVLQGRELRASTDAQNKQAEALRKQLDTQKKINEQQLVRSQTMIDQLRQQQLANEVVVLQAQQQYHASEIARMDAILDKIGGNREKSDLFESCVSKKKEHIAELGSIHSQIKKIRG